MARTGLSDEGMVMKTRRVIVTVEIETRVPLAKIKRDCMSASTAAIKVIQVQANVIKPKMKK